jgi:hypothetical protein
MSSPRRGVCRQEAKMTRINVGRVLLGGIVAAILMFLADGFIHQKLLHEYWLATMKAAGRSVQAEEHGPDLTYFAISELLRGLVLAWVYAAIRTHFGAGAKTAVIAALVVWALMFPIPFLSEVPIGFYSTTMLAMWSLYELITSVVGGLVAGALYKDAAA